MSHNHQFIQFEHQIVRRYAKTINSGLSGYRVDPLRPENRVDWMLTTPNKLFSIIWEDGKAVRIEKIGFSYDDEVIELYSDAEIKLFERWNRAAIESGALKLYDQSAPELDTANFLDDAQVETIAKIKQIPALKKKVSTLTSITTLKRVLEAAEKLDRPMSVAKVVQERINELSRNN